MLDHVTLNVADYARSKAFYEQALAPLGFGVLTEDGETCWFGLLHGDDFWIAAGPVSGPVHVAR